MNVRKIFSMIFVLVMLISCLMLSSGAVLAQEKPSSAKVVIRYADVNPVTDPVVMAAEEFGRILNEQTNGRIEVKVYPSAQLGPTTESLQALQMGALEMTRVPSAHIAVLGVKKMNVYSLPYLYRNMEHAKKVLLDGPMGKEFLDDITNSNVKLVGVGIYIVSPRHFFFTDKKVTKLSDLKGLKIRAQTGEMYTQMIEAFGASSTPIAFSELYSALQTGVVEGAENPVKGYYNKSFYEVCKYLTLDAHQIDPCAIVFSEILWKKLNAEDQQLIIAALKESAEYCYNEIVKSEEIYLEDLKKKGVIISEVEDKQAWEDVVEPLYKKFAAGFEDTIEKIKGVK